MDENAVREFEDNRVRVNTFIDGHIKKQITDEERDAYMGIANEGVRLEMEVQRLSMVLEQKKQEMGALDELDAIRVGAVMFIRSGAYDLERRQGLFNGVPLAELILHYLTRERECVETVLARRFGRGSW